MADVLDTSDIDAQIAALQAKKAAQVAKAEKARLIQEKEEAKVLVGLTPTKTATRERAQKDKVLPQLPDRPAQPNFRPPTSASLPRSKPKAPPQTLPSLPPPASRFSSSLAALNKSSSSPSSSHPKQISRSSSFTAKTTSTSRLVTKDDSPELEVDESRRRNDNDLAILENLEVGPREFGKDLEGEEEWLALEPNSGVQLSKRTLSHEAVQAHLSGRYFLRPSQIYSIIRLSRDGATYDIPVEGDWVTIAVVAERGDIRVSGGKETARDISDEEDDVEGPDDVVTHTKPAKTKNGDESKESSKWKKRRGPRKYINLKLCALPPRTPGSKSTAAGDAMLQLLLFESDAVIHHGADEDGEVRRSYKGGSGGAYEKWCNLGVGSVIAILNPRVLRPLRSGGSAPHPLTSPLALNPTSGDAVSFIGQARDLGCCSAIQKDGNRCKTWVDLRQGQVCEYHVHAAVSRGRASRAEFTASTSSYSLSTRPNAISAPFPNSKPTSSNHLPGPHSAPRTRENGGGGATYIIQGNAINTGSGSSGGFRGLGDEHIGEKLGRGRMEKRKRKEEMKEAEEVLGRLLGGDMGSTGGKYLAIIGRDKDKGMDKDKEKEKGKNTGKGKEKGEAGYGKGTGTDGGDGGSGVGEEGEEEEAERKRPFSVVAVKRIGFDPTSKVGGVESGDRAKKMAAIASLRSGDRVVRLGRPKGTVKSNVKAPEVPVEVQTKSGVETEEEEEGMIDLD